MPLFTNKIVTEAGTDVLVATLPANIEFATVTINLTNTAVAGSPVSLVKIALGTGANPAQADYIEGGAQIGPGSVLNRTCELVGPNEKIWVFSDTADVTVRISGLTKLA